MNMKRRVLCFGDSNTWGYDGESRERLPWGVRWTSLLQEKLNKEKYRVIEEGLCGRTTVFEDPLRDGRKGTALLPTLLETHAQVDVITLMLGTNDCKAAYGASAEMIGKGIEKIIGQIRSGAPDSRILLISPIWLGEKVWKPGYDPEFSEKSVAVSKHLAKVYRQIAEKENIQVYDTDIDEVLRKYRESGYGSNAEILDDIVKEDLARIALSNKVESFLLENNETE